MTLQLHFDTDRGWIAVIRAWAQAEEGISAVWVFGSRATGRRRAKQDQQEIPDLDLAYAFKTRLGCMNTGWRERLHAQIPVTVDLQCIDDDIVNAAVRTDGVLIYPYDNSGRID